jgi:hypothetical protein
MEALYGELKEPRIGESISLPVHILPLGIMPGMELILCSAVVASHCLSASIDSLSHAAGPRSGFVVGGPRLTALQDDQKDGRARGRS